MKEFIEAEYNEMIKSDPNFEDFVEHNKGKGTEEICKEYSINLEVLQRLVNGLDL